MVPVWLAQNSLLCWPSTCAHHPTRLLGTHVSSVPHIFYSTPTDTSTTQFLYLWLPEHGGGGGWKTRRLRGPESLLWDQSSTYNREATLIKFQQYSCQKKTNTMTSPVDVRMGWRILQGPTSRCRASGSKWLLRGRADILLQGHVPSI